MDTVEDVIKNILKRYRERNTEDFLNKNRPVEIDPLKEIIFFQKFLALDYLYYDKGKFGRWVTRTFNKELLRLRCVDAILTMCGLFLNEFTPYDPVEYDIVRESKFMDDELLDEPLLVYTKYEDYYPSICKMLTYRDLFRDNSIRDEIDLKVLVKDTCEILVSLSLPLGLLDSYYDYKNKIK